MQSIVAVDIGTAGAKAALVGRDGRLLASALATYPTQTAAGNRVEQQPQDWWAAAVRALQALWRQAPATSVAALILSGQMQDTILLGAEESLGAAILYSDSRAQAEAASIERRVGAELLVQQTGNPQGAASVLAKWCWLARHEPERLAATSTILLGSHDYVAWRLCGVRATDPTTAATTGLLGWRDGIWLDDLLEELGLERALLPALHPAGTVVGQVSVAAAAETGLRAGTPLLQGVGDLGATTVGVGAAAAGTLYAYLGTSGWLAVSRDEAEPLAERGVFTICHAQPGRWIQVAPLLTAGGNLDWLRQVLVPLGQPLPAYDALDALAAGARPGSGGVLYLPYLNGERSPFNDPQARAGFLGISGATTQAELVRAAMEGVAYAYRALREAIGVVQRGPLLLAGGGGQSAVWAQILADVLAVSVQVVADPGDAPARGAALVAGHALGWYSSLAPVEHAFPVAATYVPNPRHLQRYDHLYGIFVGVYPALRSAFAALAQEERSSR